MSQGPTNERGEPAYHQPVLASEVVEVFEPLPAGVVVDATFGGGGHTRRLLDEMKKGTRIVGIDRDPDALAHANVAKADEVTVLSGNFADLRRLLDDAGVEAPVGVLFDLGVSSHQFDRPERGFSYRQEGPLDMRMGPDAALDADEVVNQWDRDRLASAIRRFGEDKLARRLADAIIAARPIRSTAHLADVIAAATPAALRRRGHPARRTFQAIRIAVNDELEALRQGLDQALDVLAPGGRCAVISYHSLEDRIVKRRFNAGAGGCVCPPELPVCVCGEAAELRVLTRQPVTPSADEIEDNPRARSARLRAAEKLLERRAS
ncbi:MAG TPA: 16S rRNA (cytosine(1402)-N(4))-methyltransferase RsmH [Acidimicrobiia bacterium]|nr:16S rRNA (cytosine(1402)-N(4))-methyltransferase RsmH [Acidimicrobiia bacterium]